MEQVKEKRNSIETINKIGKVGGVLALIVKIAVICGMVGIVIGAACIYLFVPKNLFQMDYTGKADITVDAGVLELSEEEVGEWEKVIEQMVFSLNNQVLQMDSPELDGTVMTFQGVADTESVTRDNLIWILAAVFVDLLLYFGIVLMLAKLMKAFKVCTTPFSEDIIRKLRNVAISLIPWALLEPTCEEVIRYALSPNKMQFGVSISMGMVLVVISFLIIVEIFKYGAMLQQESDETL